MYKFRYHKAQSLDEAKKLLTESNEGKILAGGQTLIPTMKQRLASPEILIDIGNIKEIQNIDKKNDSIIIGAGSKHSSVATSDVVISYIPALAELAENIGDPHVRHMGTIGGSISNNDPTADYPAACLGLGATIKTVDREISADNFFTGFFDSSSEDRIGFWIAEIKVTPVNMGSSGFAETLLIVLPIFLLLSFRLCCFTFF